MSILALSNLDPVNLNPLLNIEEIYLVSVIESFITEIYHCIVSNLFPNSSVNIDSFSLFTLSIALLNSSYNPHPTIKSSATIISDVGNLNTDNNVATDSSYMSLNKLG